MLAALLHDVPDGLRARAPTQIIDMPEWALGDMLVMADSDTQAAGAERGRFPR